jgi:hypothetical protein
MTARENPPIESNRDVDPGGDIPYVSYAERAINQAIAILNQMEPNQPCHDKPIEPFSSDDLQS